MLPTRLGGSGMTQIAYTAAATVVSRSAQKCPATGSDLFDCTANTGATERSTGGSDHWQA